MSEIASIHKYSTWDEAKFKEICEWLGENIDGEWGTEQWLDINEANVVYEKYIIEINEEDYLFFKIVWE